MSLKPYSSWHDEPGSQRSRIYNACAVSRTRNLLINELHGQHISDIQRNIQRSKLRDIKQFKDTLLPHWDLVHIEHSCTIFLCVVGPIPTKHIVPFTHAGGPIRAVFIVRLAR